MRQKIPDLKSFHIQEGNLAKEAFGERESYASAALTKLTRTGYVHIFVSGGGISSGGYLVHQTTPLLAEIESIFPELASGG